MCTYCLRVLFMQILVSLGRLSLPRTFPQQTRDHWCHVRLLIVEFKGRLAKATEGLIAKVIPCPSCAYYICMQHDELDDAFTSNERKEVAILRTKSA